MLEGRPCWLPARLSPAAASHLEDASNELIVSAATIWELAIKVSLDKLKLTQPYDQWIDAAMADLGASLLPITVPFAAAQAALPWHHRDPFDRLLAAQSQVENMPLVSSDPVFDRYDVARVW